METASNAESLRLASEVQDVDFELYQLHIGRDFNKSFLNFDMAAYLEVGIATGKTKVIESPLFDIVDVELIPITVNFQLERSVTRAVSVYATGGLGYAFSEISGAISSTKNLSFYAQASAGFQYTFSEHSEVFAGVRWMYLEDVNFSDVKSAFLPTYKARLNLENAIAWEIGVRYNF